MCTCLGNKITWLNKQDRRDNLYFTVAMGNNNTTTVDDNLRSAMGSALKAIPSFMLKPSRGQLIIIAMMVTRMGRKGTRIGGHWVVINIYY